MNPMVSIAGQQPDLHRLSNLDAVDLGAVASGTPWVGPHGDASPASDNLEIAIIDDRPLMRDCFGRSLTLLEPSLDFKYYSSIEDFDNADDSETERVRVVLICVVWSKAISEAYFVHIARLRAARPSMDIILLSDIDEPRDIAKAIENGARGNIPTSVSLEVAVKAMQLVAAGGVYIPETVLLWSDRFMKENTQQPKIQQHADDLFTARQMSVIEALRRGKANKIIAYELNMCESTVKVHIRNVMKKLKAKNRTEVAFKLNSMMFPERPSVHN